MGYFKNVLIHKEENGNLCEYCNKPLVTAGRERSNGKVGGVLKKEERTMHVKCYKLDKDKKKAFLLAQFAQQLRENN